MRVCLIECQDGIIVLNRNWVNANGLMLKLQFIETYLTKRIPCTELLLIIIFIWRVLFGINTTKALLWYTGINKTFSTRFQNTVLQTYYTDHKCTVHTLINKFPHSEPLSAIHLRHCWVTQPETTIYKKIKTQQSLNNSRPLRFDLTKERKFNTKVKVFSEKSPVIQNTSEKLTRLNTHK